jgi:hypothetical protein
MEYCLNEFVFVHRLQKLVHVDWLSRVDLFDWLNRLVWQYSVDWLVPQRRQHHVGVIRVGRDGLAPTQGVNRSPWGVIVRSPDARDAWPCVSGIRGPYSHTNDCLW